jgi:hypothetical protein
MEGNTYIPRIEPDDFARRYSLRAGTLMWLLGAGASASAGIPTAWDMTWEFKQQLYASQRKVSPKLVADLANPAIQRLLQAHIDAADSFPPLGDPGEYAALFEVAYPGEADRRTYIEAKVRGAKPSYGHLALATLMRAQRAPIVWTTNFDALMADACARIYDSTSALTIVPLETPELAQQAIASSRWPVEVKLHGDFRSRRLKNTSDELRYQDERLRQTLVEATHRFGLIVIGYSGRDASIMDALSEALNNHAPFPNGLFWLHRGAEPPLPRVVDLLQTAAKKGVDAALVPIDSFDEVMRDLVRLVGTLDSKELDVFERERKRWTSPSRPQGKSHFPVLRFNAVSVEETPTVCRKVVCDIGGYAAIREAVQQAGVDILAARTRAGVLTFGRDADVRTTFEPYGIQEFDLHTIALDRLYRETGERGLLRDALTRALARERGLIVRRKGSADLLAPVDDEDKAWKGLQQLVGRLSGTVPGEPALIWKEAVATRLDWAADRLWFLVEPRTMFEGLTDENRARATDFARERTVKRYNRILNDLIAFWAARLAGGGDVLRAFRIGDGVDAVFRLGTTTAFSRRVGA